MNGDIVAGAAACAEQVGRTGRTTVNGAILSAKCTGCNGGGSIVSRCCDGTERRTVGTLTPGLPG